MPLLWEKLPTAIESEQEVGFPRRCSPLYRMWVPGGWLIRDDSPGAGGSRGPVLPASGPTQFIPDPNHEWQADAPAPQVAPAPMPRRGEMTLAKAR